MEEPVIKTEVNIESLHTDSDINPLWYEVKMEREDTPGPSYECSEVDFDELERRNGSNNMDDEENELSSENNDEANTREYENVKVFSYNNLGDDKSPETEFVPRMFKKSHIMNPENGKSRKESSSNSTDGPPSGSKRKRSANFTEDEKMRFLRLLQDKGRVIISRNTAHDMKSNKMKEHAWEAIRRELNSNGRIMRSTHTLKKLWQKLKSDVKAFRSARQNIRRAGGVSSLKMPNHVLELVVEINECESEKTDVPDCDSDNHIPDDNSPDENSQTVEEVREWPSYAMNGKTMTNGKINKLQSQPIVNEVSISAQTPTSSQLGPLEDSFERCESEEVSVTAERLRSERSKFDLIEHKMEQETELHELRMKNERRLFALKEQILQRILKRIDDRDTLDADVVSLALSITGEK